MQRFFNDIEAAEVLGLSVETLRRWRLERKGPKYYKLGRNVRYLYSDLAAYAMPVEPRAEGQECR
jgi:excisionase family DNA binding protein